MKVEKTCERCKISCVFEGKGCTRAKYCKPCGVIVKKEQQTKALKKRDDRRQEEKGYIIPTDDQLYFYGYKEPLKKYEGGYGYYGCVAYSKDKEMVQCHLCGRLFRNVGVHVSLKHRIPKEDYKDMVGLPQNAALVGESTREKLIFAHNEFPSFSHVGKTKEEIRAHMKKMSDKGVKRGKGVKRTGWSMERRNLTGNCPEQVIEKIKKLGEKLGRRPGAKEYVAEYGSLAPIITIYGTWENAVKLAGMTTYTEQRAISTDPKFLIEQMRQFFEKHGRSPRTSDMKRGLLPAHQTYWSVFGSINNARVLAGVPAVIQINRRRFDEVVFTETERERYIERNERLSVLKEVI